MSGLCSAQTDEPIKMAYERQTRVGLWDHVVNRVCTLAPPGNCDGTVHARGVCTACRLAGISLGYTSVIVTARVVYAAESMQLTGVRPSVCLSVPYATAAGLLLWARRPGDIDRLLQLPRAVARCQRTYVSVK